MGATATLNARLPETLKRHGTQVLERNGVSTTEAVRRLYEYLEREQDVPAWMRADGQEARAAKRDALRGFVGSVRALPDRSPDDPRSGDELMRDYRDHLVERHCFTGVRE